MSEICQQAQVTQTHTHTHRERERTCTAFSGTSPEETAATTFITRAATLTVS
jgi:DNA-binding CsgD family transcriptional regulator